ncbi:hypothetical protein B0H13DRAFT_2280640 [Mycena leptocephala]|nr:hypothetical protein B0H13DRAFT_2280640 [Mycena leptocephala]
MRNFSATFWPQKNEMAQGVKSNFPVTIFSDPCTAVNYRLERGMDGNFAARNGPVNLNNPRWRRDSTFPKIVLTEVDFLPHNLDCETWQYGGSDGLVGEQPARPQSWAPGCALAYGDSNHAVLGDQQLEMFFVLQCPYLYRVYYLVELEINLQQLPSSHGVLQITVSVKDMVVEDNVEVSLHPSRHNILVDAYIRHRNRA